ncbi:hypothetical protein CORC01_04313 [Colletotrichum orchidophilum]|uniref:Uncharacterized protein n=1 Tax=Colletotrichum orchidophilum TaxID=1209926 RepID=A0A1G4BFW9_9PEZI|nr:uncharacterized protein CORC01_04313 [Colletotrichum orchidophilum]OHF00332.1 hypothetical protein CORC01_04313 [Colletotrichum orchidophilum]
MLNCTNTEHGGTYTRTRFPDDDTPQAPIHFRKLGKATMLTHRQQLLAESLYTIRSQSCMPSIRPRRILDRPGTKMTVCDASKKHLARREGASYSSLIGGGSVSVQQMDVDIKAIVDPLMSRLILPYPHLGRLANPP